MFDLPVYETVLLILAIGTYSVAALWGLVKLYSRSRASGWPLPVLVGIGLVFEGLLLILRGIKSGAFPLTGLFESLILLTLVFGLLYLFLSMAIKRIWFMVAGVCVLVVIVLMASLVAIPASSPQAIAATPWALVHGIAMIFGLMLTAFSASTGLLYVLSKHKLKNKQTRLILGKMPNLEALERMSRIGLQAGFVLITCGLVSGLMMAVINSAALEASIAGWLSDPKIILMEFLWVVLGAVLVLKYFQAVKTRTVSYVVAGAFVVVLFALVSIAITGWTIHDFAGYQVRQSEEVE